MWKKCSFGPQREGENVYMGRGKQSTGSSHSSSACLPASCLTSLPIAPSPLQRFASTKSPSLNTTQQTRTQFAGNHTFPAVSLGLFSLFSISPQVTLLLSLCHSESFLPSHAMPFLVYCPFSPNCFPLPMLNIFTFSPGPNEYFFHICHASTCRHMSTDMSNK